MAADDGPITIVLADDHAVVRTGLRMLLDAEDGFEVVAEAGDADAAPAHGPRAPADVLVLDLNMPGEPSLPAIPRVAAGRPNTRVVVLTMQDDPAFAREALRAGAARLRAQGGRRRRARRGRPRRRRGPHLPQPASSARGSPPPRPSRAARPTTSPSARSRCCA